MLLSADSLAGPAELVELSTPQLGRRLSVWGKADTVFRHPKVEIALEVNAPLCRSSAPHAVLCSLHGDVVGLLLAETADLANAAGFSYSISPARVAGFEVWMAGCVSLRVREPARARAARAVIPRLWRPLRPARGPAPCSRRLASRWCCRPLRPTIMSS